MAALFAAVARTRIIFDGMLFGLILLMSIHTVQVDFFPNIRLRWILTAAVPLLAAAMLLLRRQFYRILLVFLFGSFTVDVARGFSDAAVHAVVNPASAKEDDNTDAPHRHHHVIHVVLDGMIGLGAMPPECDECVHASAALQQALQQGNFRIYPYAFANYEQTLVSIPSILIGALVRDEKDYIHQDNQRFSLKKNAYFDS